MRIGFISTWAACILFLARLDILEGETRGCSLRADEGFLRDQTCKILPGSKHWEGGGKTLLAQLVCCRGGRCISLGGMQVCGPKFLQTVGSSACVEVRECKHGRISGGECGYSGDSGQCTARMLSGLTLQPTAGGALEALVRLDEIGSVVDDMMDLEYQQRLCFNIGLLWVSMRVACMALRFSPAIRLHAQRVSTMTRLKTQSSRRSTPAIGRGKDMISRGFHSSVLFGAAIMALLLQCCVVSGQTATSIAPVNAASVGTSSITIGGSSFGTSDSSPKARVGGSACEASNWVSAASLTCKLSAGVGTNRAVTVTIFSNVSTKATFTGLLTYDAPSVANVQSTNLASLGGSSLTVSGAGFGTSSYCSRLRLGGSACPETSWKSDTSIYGKAPAGLGVALPVAVTTALAKGTLTAAVSYDGPVVRGAPTNGATDNAIYIAFVNLNGSGFGTYSSTPMTRMGGSGCESTRWTSDSSLRCQAASGIGSGYSAVVTVADRRKATVSNLFSYDIPSGIRIAPGSNTPATGGSSMSIVGANFSPMSVTSRARLGGSACQASIWVSDSSLLCKSIAFGSQSSLYNALAVTIGVQVGGSLTRAWSYDAITLVSASTSNCAITGRCITTITGVGFGSADSSVKMRIGSTACETTPWLSQTTISCQVPGGRVPGIGVTPIVATISQQVVTLQATFTYDNPTVTGGTLGLWDGSALFNQSSSLTLPSTAGGTIGFQGFNLISGNGANVTVVTFGPRPKFDSYVCSMVAPPSAASSRIVCDVPSGAGFDFKLKVIVGGRKFVGTDSVSYPSPILTRGTIVMFGGAPSTGCTNLVGTTTVGGIDVVELHGNNLGNLISQLSVVYGQTGAPEYRCNVTFCNHTLIRCIIASGSGTGHRFNVTLGRQWVVSTDTFSYPPPYITSISVAHPEGSVASNGAGSTTMGGVDVVTLTGGNFGPEPRHIKVGYLSATSSSGQLWCAVLRNGTSHKAVKCVTSSGSGASFHVTVNVRGQTGSVSSGFRYPPPILRAASLRIIGASCVSPTRCYTQRKVNNKNRPVSRSTMGGIDFLEMDGNNFGPDAGAVTVTLGKVVGGSYVASYLCATFPKTSFALNHTRIQCIVPPGVGIGYVFQVTVSGLASDVGSDILSYPDPGIFSGTLKLTSSSAAGVLKYNPSESGAVTVKMGTTIAGKYVEFSGKNFGPNVGDATISYGPSSNPTKYSCSRIGVSGTWSHTSIRCALAPGSGTGLVFLVTLSSGQQSKIGADTLAYPPPLATSSTLRYASCNTSGTNVVQVLHTQTTPGSTLVSLNRGSGGVCMSPSSTVNATSSAGGDLIRFDGKFFGPDASNVLVTYSRNLFPFTYVAQVEAESFSDTSITVRTQPGAGRGLFFTVNVSGQLTYTSDVYNYPLNTSLFSRTSSPLTTTLSSASLSTAVAGVGQAVSVHSRDSNGSSLLTGGTSFVASADGIENSFSINVTDQYDGTYSFNTPFTRSGSYKISVRLSPDLSHIQGSPFSVVVSANPAVSPQLSGINMPNTVQTAGVSFAYVLLSRDSYGNEITGLQDLYYTEAFAPSILSQNVSASTVPSPGSRISAVWTLTISGTYNVKVWYNSTLLQYGFQSIFLFPAVDSPSSAKLTSSRALSTDVESSVLFSLSNADAYGNVITKGGARVVASITQALPLDFNSIQVLDGGKGDYSLLCRFTLSGSYTIAVGLGDISRTYPFSPLSLSVAPGDVAASVSAVASLVDTFTAGIEKNAEIYLTDKYSNIVPEQPFAPQLLLYSTIGGVAKLDRNSSAVFVNNSGTTYYSGKIFSQVSGSYILSVTHKSVNLYGSPFSVQVVAGAIDGSKCTAQQTILTAASLSKAVLEGVFAASPSFFKGRTKNQPIHVIVTAKDSFENPTINRQTSLLSVTSSPVFAVTSPSYIGLSTYISSFTPTYAGLVSITVRYNGVNIGTGVAFSANVFDFSGAISAANSYLFGSPTSVAGGESYFYIQAVDNQNIPMATGGSTFTFSLDGPSNSSSISSVVSVIDSALGWYSVAFTPTLSGTYVISVSLSGSALSKSPLSILVYHGKISALGSTVFGSGLSIATSASPGEFFIQARDVYGNLQGYDPRIGLPFEANIFGAAKVDSVITDLGNGTAHVSFNITVSGRYSIEVKTISSLGHELVGGSALSLLVQPLALDPKRCFVYEADSGVMSIAAAPAEIVLGLRDKYDNPTPNASEPGGVVVWINDVQIPSANVSRRVNFDQTLSVLFTVTRSSTFIVRVVLVSGSFSTNISLSVQPSSPFANNTRVEMLQASPFRVDQVPMLQIGAVDSFGNNLTSGSATFSVFMLPLDPASLRLAGKVTDNQNGTYYAQFPALLLGNYTIAVYMVDLQSTFLIRLIPVEVITGYMSPTTSFPLSLDGLSTQVGVAALLNISAKDSLYNPTKNRNGAVNATVTPAYGQTFLTVTDVGTSIIVLFNTTRSGEYAVSVFVGSLGQIATSPFNIVVAPSAVEPSLAVFSGGGLSAAVAGTQSFFSIEARDKFGNFAPKNVYETVPKFVMSISQVGGMQIKSASVTGSSGNSYNATYLITTSGTFALSITYSLVSIAGFPMNVSVTPAGVSAATSSVTQITPASPVAGNLLSVKVQSRDSFGNSILVGGTNFTAELFQIDSLSAQQAGVVMSDALDGTYSFSALVTKSGAYFLGVFLLDKHLSGSPASIAFAPASASAAASTGSGPGLVSGRINVKLPFSIYIRDSYGNNLNSGYAGAVQVRYTFSNAEVVTENLSQDAGAAGAVYSSFTRDSQVGVTTVEIKVAGAAIAGSPFSVSLVTAVTGAPVGANCYAKGVGISSATAGAPTSFVIQAVDSAGLLITSGGSLFIPELFKGSFYKSIGSRDNGDGTYGVNVDVTASGTYTLAVNILGVPISGSPFTVDVFPASTDAASSSLSGQGLTAGTAGLQASFLIQARDRFSNVQRFFFGDAYSIYKVTLAGPRSTSATLTAIRDSTFIASYSTTVAGSYQVYVAVSGTPSLAPIQLMVYPGQPSPKNSVLAGLGASTAVAGDAAQFRWRPIDDFGNLILAATSILPQLSFSPVSVIVDPLVKSDGAGTVLATYIATVGGEYRLFVSLPGTSVHGSGWNVSVGANVFSAVTSSATGLGVSIDTAGVLATFTVVARDMYANLITKGFTFTTLVKALGGDFRANCNSTSYLCSYMVTRSGSLSVSVLKGASHVKGSPFPVTVNPALVDTSASSTYGTSLSTAGRDNTFFILLKDQYGNQLTNGGRTFSVKLSGRDIIVVPTNGISDSDNGAYSVSYFASVSGSYSLSILSQSLPIAGSPINMTVSSGPPSPTVTSLFFQQLVSCGLSILCGTVDAKHDMIISLRDAYSNPVEANIFDMILSTRANSILRYGLINKGSNVGEYLGFFVATASGAYTISVTVNAVDVGGSPLTADITAGRLINSGSILLTGTTVTLSTAGSFVPFQMQARDVFGNSVFEPTYKASLIRAVGPDGNLVSFETNLTRSGPFAVDVVLKITRSGAYSLSLSLLGINAIGTPVNLIVRPGPIYAPASEASGPGAKGSVQQKQATITFSPRDQYGNLAAFQGSLFQTLKGNLLYPGSNPEPMQVFLQSTDPFPFEPASSSERFSSFALVYFPRSASAGVYIEIKIGDIGIKGSPLPVSITFGGGTPTATANSFATGQGISSSTAGSPSSFLIQAADASGLWLSTGGATFAVSTTFTNDFRALTVIDKGTGQYSVAVGVTASGTYTVSVIIATSHIVGSPFSVLVLPGATNAVASTVTGAGMSSCTAGIQGSFLVQARDKFYNMQRYFFGDGSSIFSIAITGPATNTARFSALRDSAYVVSYNVTRSGAYNVALSATWDPTPKTWSLYISTLSLDISLTRAVAANLRAVHSAGKSIFIGIDARDSLGNAIAPPPVSTDLSHFQASIVPGGPVSVRAVDGIFTAVTNITRSGSYIISIFLAQKALPGSPYALSVTPSSLSVAATTSSGEALGGGKAGVILDIVIYPRDAFGNSIQLLMDSDVALGLTGSQVASLSATFVYRKAASVTASYLVSQPCAACRLSVVVRGQHLTGSPFAAAYVMSDPPRITKAVFQYLLTAADVSFDLSTNRNGQLGAVFACDLVFDAPSVLAAGNGSSCVWKTDSVLSMVFGSGSTLLPGSSLVLSAVNSLRNAGQTSYMAIGSAVLQLPRDVQLPVPVIMGPRAMGECDSLSLDASQSTGGGGRKLEYRWGLELGPSNRESIVASLAALPLSADSVLLAPASILLGQFYTFSLRLRDSFGQATVAYHAVVASAAPLPVVTIVSIPTKFLSRYLSLTLNGAVSLPSCGSSTSATLEWESIGGPLFPITDRTRRSNTISVSSNTLVAGELYAVRLTATSSAASSFADVSFTVASTPLVAAIRGGDRTVSYSEPLVLDASDSVDPDQEPGSPSYTWQCQPSPCFPDAQNILLESGPILTVATSQLSVGTILTFTLSFNKDPGPRKASASARISVVADAIAHVSFAVQGGAKAKVNSGDRLVLMGSVTSPTGACIPSFVWNSPTGLLPIENAAIRTTSMSSPNLVIRGGALVRGSTYTFQLRGACVASRSEGISSMTIVVNSPPAGGSFLVSPDSGIAAQTLFKLACAGWVDDATDLPLSYQFLSLRASVAGSEVQPLTRAVLTNIVSVLLPGPPVSGAAQSVVLSVKVCDSLGECAKSSDRGVTVTAPAATAAQLLDSTLTLLQGVGNTDAIFQLGSSVALLLNQASSEGGTERARIVTSFNTASLSLDFSTDTVSLMAYSLEVVLDAPTLQLGAMHDISLALLSSLSAASMATGINTSAAASLVGGLSGLSRSADLGQPNNVRRAAAAKHVFDGVASVMRNIGMSLLVGRVSFEDRVTVTKGDLRQTVWRLAQSQVGASQELSSPCSDGVKCSAVRMPTQWNWASKLLDSQVLTWGPRVRHVEQGAFLAAPITTVLAMDGTTTVQTVFAEHPIFVDMFVTPSTIKGSTGAAGKDRIATCEYWDAGLGKFSKKGCIAYSSNSTMVSCACYHLTDFTSLMRGTSDLPTLTTAISIDKDAPSPHSQDGFGAAVVGFTAVATFLLAVLAHLFDRFQVRRFQPDLASALLGPDGGYVKAAGVGKVRKSRFGIFLGMFGARLSHLFKSRHGIISIIFWTPRDPYTRTPRVVALLLHLGSTMVISVILMTYAGFTDFAAGTCGVVTSLILLPIHPLLSEAFRGIAPRKFKDRGVLYAKKRPFSAGGESMLRVQGIIFYDDDKQKESKAEVPRRPADDEDDDDGDGSKDGTGVREGATLTVNSLGPREIHFDENELASIGLSEPHHNSRVREQSHEQPPPPPRRSKETQRFSNEGSMHRGREQSFEAWATGEAFGAWVTGEAFGGTYVPPSRKDMELPDLEIEPNFSAPVRRESQPQQADPAAKPTDLAEIGRAETMKLDDADDAAEIERPASLPPIKKWILKTDTSMIKIPQGGKSHGVGAVDPFGNGENRRESGIAWVGAEDDDGEVRKLPRFLFVVVYLAAALYYLFCAVVVSLHTYDMSPSTKAAWIISIVTATLFHFAFVEPLAYVIYAFVTIRHALVAAIIE